MAALSLSLFGSFQARLGEKQLTQFRTTKVQALLIFLVTESGQVHQREALTALLWPDLPQRSARVNLRQILYQLRKLIPELDAADGTAPVPFVVSKRQAIQVNPQARISLDTAACDRLLAESQTHDHVALLACSECRAKLDAAVALYKGEFLTDFYLEDSNQFEDWVQGRRAAYQRQVLDALHTLAAMHMKQGSYAEAQAYAHRQLAIDNLNEQATRQLMEALARNGQRSEGLAAYDRCRQRLGDELGVAPSAKTTALYQRIVEDTWGLETTPTAGGPGAARGLELLDEIGSGAFGVVHRAYQHGVGREVALKIIRPQFANQAEFIRNFEAEAQIIASLEHPHIVPLYDYWREPHGAFLVMRLLRGGDLRTALASGPWSLTAATTLVNQIAAALLATHIKGVVHGDIKPSNILLDEEGNAYLSDFGIARKVHTNGLQTLQQAPGRAMAYLAPEQVQNEPVSSLTDQYSLGIVLYELLTGYSAKTFWPMKNNGNSEPLPLVKSRARDLPASIDTVIRRATARKAQDRYADIVEFAAALHTAAGIGTGTLLPPGVLENTGEITNPYKGLRPYQEADADFFFGRDDLVHRLVDRCTSTRFLALVGPSGSGKSSVVKAGLLPALRRGAAPGSSSWFIAEITPGAHPLEELEAALLRVAVDPPASLLSALERDERGLGRVLKRVVPANSAADGPSRLLLVIDQFEELFTLVTDSSSRQLFLSNLLSAIKEPRSRLRVVVTLRADFYARPLQLPELGELLRQHTEVILPLSPRELEEAITRPAALVGVRLEPGLAAAIAADVADQPGALPLLQYALTELFESRQGRSMTHAAYREIGGVSGALGRRAEEIYLDLAESDREIARQIFLRLVKLGQGAEAARRRVPLGELASLAAGRQGEPAAEATLDHNDLPLAAFGRYRFLTFDRDPTSGTPTVEIAHESLLKEWPRLAGWLAESRDDVLRQRLLAEAAAEWELMERDPGFLLRGSRLQQVGEWVEKTTLSLTGVEKAFVEASQAAQQARRLEEQERQRRELETVRKLAETERDRADEQRQAAERLQRRALLLVGALVVAAMLAVAAVVNGNRALRSAGEAELNLAVALTREVEARNSAFIAERRGAEAEREAIARATAEAAAIAEREEARRQTDLTAARELALAALNNLEADPELSILLALRALDRSHTKEAEEALHRALQTSRIEVTLAGHEGAVYGAAFSPDGTLVATVSDDRTVKIWNSASGRLLHTLPFTGIEYLGLTLDFHESSGELALVAVGDNFESVILHVWDPDTGALLTEKELPILLENWSLVLSPDWNWILAGHEDGTAELWDVESAALLHTFAAHDDVVEALAFSPDSSVVAITSLDGQVMVWDTGSVLEGHDEEPIASFKRLGDGFFHGATFSNDGQRLALAGGLQTELQIWDLADADEPQLTLRGFPTFIEDAAFLPDDGYLATSGRDGNVHLWETGGGQRVLTLAGHSGLVRLGLSSDGRRLATASTDGTARIWNVQPQAIGEIAALTGVAADMDLALSPDERKIAVGNVTGPGAVWDLKTGKRLFTLSGEPNTAVYRVDFSPDGAHIASAGEDGLVRIWDAESGEEQLSFVSHTGGKSGGLFSGAVDVAYSPDGRRLATAGADSFARLWDAETGREVLTFAGHTTGLHSLAYSPDGRYIATSSDFPETAIKVWDAQSGEALYSFGPLDVRALGLSFSPDSGLLGAAGTGGYITVFDLSSGDVLSKMGGQAAVVRTLLFTPDGQRIITGGGESASIWDVATGTELVNLVPGEQFKLALSRDGRRLYASGGGHPGVRVYTVALEDAIAVAQSRLTRTMTEDECRQYLHVEHCPADNP